MFALDYFSRDNTTSVNGETIFCCFNPKDGSSQFERVADDVLALSDALVLYRREDIETAENEYANVFSHVTYMIVLVTKSFLEDTEALCRADLNYAHTHHIPLLPIICENGLEASFNDLVEHLHTININSDTYQEKLKQFVDSSSRKQSLVQNAKDAFLGKLFISYRKKDYDAILPCVKALHRSEQFRNIAIWYDSYLHIGENFDSEIRKNLEEADAVIVIATDNVWNEQPNYVLKQEIPLAEQFEKKILYVNYNLSHQYAEKINTVQLHDTEKINQFLFEVFKNTAKPTAQQQHLLGLAYLNGFFVEKNPSYALDYLMAAARELYRPAIKELVDIYRFGHGAKRSKKEALDYQFTFIEISRKEFLSQKTAENGIAFLNELLCYQTIAKEFGDIQSGFYANEQAIEYDEEFSNLNNTEVSYLLQAIYRQTASLQFHSGLLEEAQASFSNAERVLEEPSDWFGRREKLLTMSEKALFMLQCGDINGGFLRLSSVLCSFWQFFVETKLLSAARDSITTLSRLCYIIPKLEPEEVETLPFDVNVFFDDLLKASQALYTKTRDHEDLVDFARAYFYLGEWLGRSDDRLELMKANGAYNKAFRLLKEEIHNIREFNEFKFFITTIKKIAESYLRLDDFSGALGAYTRAYNLAIELHENAPGNVWLLQKLSELSEGLGDAVAASLNKGDLSVEEYPSPATLYKSAYDIEQKLAEMIKDDERFLLRATQLLNKISAL